MTKNTAGQKVGAQMVSATDGSAFTGSVTVAVTGDAGTQATGSVGSGACTHEGNGYHTYAPAQAETNYDLIAFTFTGTGAVPATVQVFTTAIAKSSAKMPATIAAGDLATDSITADALKADAVTEMQNGLATAAALATVDSIVDDILVDTGTTLQAELDGIQADTEDIQSRLPAALTGDGNIKADALKLNGSAPNNLSAAQVNAEADTAIADAALATAANLATVAGYLDTEIAAILADTNELQTDWANGGRLDNILDARSSQTSVDDLPTNAELATALAAADDAVLAAIAALNNLSSAGAQSAAAAALTAYGAALQTTALAVKAKTDKLTFDADNALDANVQKVNDVTLVGDGSATPWGPA